MKRLQRVFCVALAVSLLAACGRAPLGKLPPSTLKPWDLWKKDGYARNQVRDEYVQCRGEEADTLADFEEVDLCMLKKSFYFVDDPIRPKCDPRLFPRLAKLPRCQSLRNQ